MSLYWLCYRHNNQISVVMEPGLAAVANRGIPRMAEAGRHRRVLIAGMRNLQATRCTPPWFETGDLQLLGVYLHQRQIPTRSRKTRRDRMQAKLQEIKKELRERMHQPIPKQGQWLKQIVTGYFHYHAVPTNSRALARFRHHIAHLWLRVLRRRSQRDGFTRERIEKLVDEWLPKTLILHPWPSVRFAVNHPRWEPCARIGLARICAGGAQ